MAASRDRSTLRQLVGDVVVRLDANTHATLNEAFAKMGMLPNPPEEGTKRERVARSFAQVPDSDLHTVALNLLANGYATTAQRLGIEDVLWAEASPPEIPSRIRRELARSLDLADLIRNESRFMGMLSRFWVLADEMSPLMDAFFGTPGPSLKRDIEQHVFRNPGDWSTEDLFEHLGAFEAGNARFARFLEALVSADVLLDEAAQRHLVAAINTHVRAAAIELRETGAEGGYPRFSMVSTRLAENRKPKNIIFASLTKPDIRFQSAMDNDIEIVGNRDDSLVYDRPTPEDGLRWRDLQTWWQDKHEIPTEADAKASLYRRLRRSLPDNSPGQQNLFDCTTRSSAPRSTTTPPCCRGLAPLGPPDRPRTRPPGPAALTHGLPAPAPSRTAHRARSRRIPALHPRPRPAPRQRKVRGDDGRRPRPETQGLRGLPVRPRRTQGRDRGPRAPGAVPASPVPALQRQRRNSLTPTAPPVRTPLPARARQGRS
ncbi:hypothetical protein [Streptomyces virginiae]|uniref:AbiJ-related protein n=1 Tax=Streptomyces virginiae TaxID=1961 RepID=UPI002256AA10|nr:hypothetical protein [Streptomyces virginiae]MCX5276835.1 hypothetical protein [Streptomyces virginiae]